LRWRRGSQKVLFKVPQPWAHVPRSGLGPHWAPLRAALGKKCAFFGLWAICWIAFTLKPKPYFARVGGSCSALLCRLFEVLLPGSLFQWLDTILDDFKDSLGAHGRPTGYQEWSPWLPVSIPHRDPRCCKKLALFQPGSRQAGGDTQNHPEEGVEASSSLAPHFAHLGSPFGTHLAPSCSWCARLGLT
jgi:hypothetical protein